MSFASLWESLLPVGRDSRTGGYRRFSWTPAGAACGDWFTRAAAARGLPAATDRNGNLWAWWDVTGHARDGAIAIGSHLDSVPDGGAFDGALGVVSAFAAVDLLRERGITPARPVAVVAFAEEEGSRFGVACLGSRLTAGALEPDAARDLRDAEGISLAAAMSAAGRDPAVIGPDDHLLASLAAYVELHIEQGRALVELGAPVAIAERIWPHSRWRLDLSGRADHAGTTALADRHDPMLPAATAVLAARRAAAEHGGLATVGKVVAEPGGANVICSAVHVWLDIRVPDEELMDPLLTSIRRAVSFAAGEHGVREEFTRESHTPPVVFDPGLRARLSAVLMRAGITAPVLATGAGHDAGVLAARLPTAMLFVRNPTGISHAPAEQAGPADCETGVAALAAAVEDLACR